MNLNEYFHETACNSAKPESTALKDLKATPLWIKQNGVFFLELS
jgi:hypothetical protein